MVGQKEYPELCAFLARAGFGPNEIEKMTLTTRLFHDLGIDGDNFFDTVAILQTEFGVDLSTLEWEKYCPSEGRKLFPLSLVDKFNRAFRDKKSYAPLTLAMIAAALLHRRWDD